MNIRCTSCSNHSHYYKLPEPAFDPQEINQDTKLCWSCDIEREVAEIEQSEFDALAD